MESAEEEFSPMMLEIIYHVCPETGCVPRSRKMEFAEEEFSPHDVRDHLPCLP